MKMKMKYKLAQTRMEEAASKARTYVQSNVCGIQLRRTYIATPTYTQIYYILHESLSV